jgi:hypothetical protein
MLFLFFHAEMVFCATPKKSARSMSFLMFKVSLSLPMIDFTLCEFLFVIISLCAYYV